MGGTSPRGRPGGRGTESGSGKHVGARPWAPERPGDAGLLSRPRPAPPHPSLPAASGLTRPPRTASGGAARAAASAPPPSAPSRASGGSERLAADPAPPPALTPPRHRTPPTPIPPPAGDPAPGTDYSPPTPPRPSPRRGPRPTPPAPTSRLKYAVDLDPPPRRAPRPLPCQRWTPPLDPHPTAQPAPRTLRRPPLWDAVGGEGVLTSALEGTEAAVPSCTGGGTEVGKAGRPRGADFQLRHTCGAGGGGGISCRGLEAWGPQSLGRRSWAWSQLGDPFPFCPGQHPSAGAHLPRGSAASAAPHSSGLRFPAPSKGARPVHLRTVVPLTRGTWFSELRRGEESHRVPCGPPRPASWAGGPVAGVLPVQGLGGDSLRLGAPVLGPATTRATTWWQ